MLDTVKSGVLTPRELEIVARAVGRICKERGFQLNEIDAQELAAKAFSMFQANRHMDEAALEEALREEVRDR